MYRTYSKWLGALVVCNVCAWPAVSQTVVSKHPGYLQALADLRAARYYINRDGGSPKLKGEEVAATKEIDAAMSEIKSAQIDDGKGVSDIPSTVDDHEHGSPFAKALEDIAHARGNIEKEPDTPDTHKLRSATFDHLSRANDAAQQAHMQWLAEIKDPQKK